MVSEQKVEQLVKKFIVGLITHADLLQELGVYDVNVQENHDILCCRIDNEVKSILEDTD